MPGPVSDSYDPEFGTGERANTVRENIEEVRNYISEVLGPGRAKLKDIVEVCEGPSGESWTCTVDEKILRIIRFALNRAMETI
jgi:hypothetical protein